MDAPETPCPQCGYPPTAAPAPCRFCSGTVRTDPLGPAIRPGVGFALIDVLHGFAEFWRAAIRLLTRKEYFGRLGGAVAANAVAAAAVIALGVFVYHPAASAVARTPWGALSSLRDLIAWEGEAFPAILTAVLLLLTGPAILQTLTLPFLGSLADATEQSMGGPHMRPPGGSAWRDLTANLRASAQVLAMQLVVLVPCLLLSFCHTGLVLALMLGGTLSAVLWLEIPFARRGYPIEQRIRTARRNWARALGFGMAFQLGMFVPIFNVLLLAPTAAVAISALYLYGDKTPSLARPLA